MSKIVKNLQTTDCIYLLYVLLGIFKQSHTLLDLITTYWSTEVWHLGFSMADQAVSWFAEPLKPGRKPGEKYQKKMCPKERNFKIVKIASYVSMFNFVQFVEI